MPFKTICSVITFFSLLLGYSLNAKSASYFTRQAARINNVSPKTKHNTEDYIFLGCRGDEESAKQIRQVLSESIKAWNGHQIDPLLNYYAPYFKSRDGLDLDQIRSTLLEFWAEYPDARINSYATSIYVCGDYASVSLVEVTTGTSPILDSKTLPFPGKFQASIRGMTTLKRISQSWKITAEDVSTETMFKYYGPVAESFLNHGNVRLVITQPVQANENYIAQLKYSLPEQFHAIAFIDKILLGEFPSESEKTTGDASKKDLLKKIKEEKGKLDADELSNISRNLEGENGTEGLRRLFKANNYGQDEMVRTQIEIVSFENNIPRLSGVIGLSERVIPHPIPKEEPLSERQIVTKTFKEEAAIQARDSKEKADRQQNDDE